MCDYGPKIDPSVLSHISRRELTLHLKKSQREDTEVSRKLFLNTDYNLYPVERQFQDQYISGIMVLLTQAR